MEVLGTFFLEEEDYKSSLNKYRECLSVREKLFINNHPDLKRIKRLISEIENYVNGLMEEFKEKSEKIETLQKSEIYKKKNMKMSVKMNIVPNSNPTFSSVETNDNYLSHVKSNSTQDPEDSKTKFMNSFNLFKGYNFFMFFFSFKKKIIPLFIHKFIFFIFLN